MAKAPVLSRKSFFERVNRNSPIIRITDYNIVETEFGPGVETRSPSNFGDGNKVLDYDLLDMCADSITHLGQDEFNQMFQGVHVMSQTLRDFSY